MDAPNSLTNFGAYITRSISLSTEVRRGGLDVCFFEQDEDCTTVFEAMLEMRSCEALALQCIAVLRKGNPSALITIAAAIQAHESLTIEAEAHRRMGYFTAYDDAVLALQPYTGAAANGNAAVFVEETLRAWCDAETPKPNEMPPVFTMAMVSV